MSILSFDHAAKINFFRSIGGSINHRSSITQLKSAYTYQEKCVILDNLPQNFQKLVYGIPFPKEIKDLGEAKFVKCNNDLISEINWLLLTIRKYYFKFSQLIKLKTEFESLLMKAYYRDAANILEQVEKEFGQSMWLIEVKLLLKELEKGMTENKLFLSEVTEKRGAHYISVISDLISKKIEKERSTNRFVAEFKNTINQISGAFGAQTTEYYYFKANVYGLSRYKYRPMIMAIEQQTSLIDRYLTLITCLRQHIANEEITEIEKRELSGRIYYLYKKVKDPCLLKLQAALSLSFPDTLNDEELWAHKIIDYYTEGNYKEVLDESKSYLKHNFQNFEIYHIYCKSLINLKKIFEPIPGNETIVNEILRNVYGLIQNENDPEIYYRALSKIGMQLSTFKVGDQIMNFILSENEGDNQYFRQSLLINQSFMPLTGQFFGNTELTNSYYDHLLQVPGSGSKTINFLKAINDQDINAFEQMQIPNYRKFFYEAQYFQKIGELDTAINHWLHLKNNFGDIPHVYKSSIENLFNTYISAKKYQEALSLYVNTFFTNPYYITRLKTDNLQEELRKSKMTIVERNINLPLFFSIAGAKKTILSNAVEQYVKSCGVNTPAQYVDGLTAKIIGEDDQSKVFYFLHQVCTMALFTHMVKIKGSKNKLNERLSVCIYMLNNEPAESEMYINEIDEIERELLIQEGLQEYDESKIFINDKMIKDTLLKEMEADFERYQKYGSLIRQHPNVKVLITNALFDINNDVEKKKKIDRAIFSSDPMFDQFKQMFLELREKFLFSQYGLMEFLSGRIRHGVFKSEIRPKFEKLELITERDASTGVYRQSEYWRGKFNYLSSDKLERILYYQTVFSKKIDNLIEEDALKKFLLIKIENRNPEGWFNYEFSDIELAVSYSTFHTKVTFEEFVDKCFDFLYLRTDKNLTEIRQRITGEYSEQYESAISDFENSIREISPEYLIQELLGRIADIRAYVQNDLIKVANWFNRSGSITKDFLIDKIVEISLRHTNRGYEKKEIRLTWSNNCNRVFKGEFYPYFIDLIRVFFVNILEHNTATNGHIPAELTIKEHWPILKISINNELAEPNKDVDTVPYAKVDEARSQTEGKSGFPKVKRILGSYLGKNTQENRLEFPSSYNGKFTVDCYINIKDLIVE